MAKRRVGKRKGGFKRSRKPPLHVLSDFGTQTNSPIAKRIGNDKRTRASLKTDYSRK